MRIRFLLPVLFLAYFHLCAPVGAAPPAKADKPAVLFLDFRRQEHYRTYFKEFLRDMHRAGFEVDYADVNKVDPSRFRKFNVIVYLNVPNWDPKTHEPADAFRKQVSALKQHLAAGGGVLVMSHPGPQRLPCLWHLLKPYGLEVQVAVIHDSRAKCATLVQMPFAYTDDVAPHPVTEGVRGIWFPVYPPKGRVWNANTSPFKTDDTWQVLVRTSDSAYVTPYTFNMAEVDRYRPQETAHGKQPLLAVKDLAPGRLAFCAVDASYHIFGGRAPAWEGVTMGPGLDGKPSDMERLMLNLLQWLGEPSLKSGKLGGAKTVPDKLNPPVLVAPPPKKSWDFWRPGKRFHGVIGARTSYSVGKSTAAEYAAAARRLGFSFVFFAEPLAKISRENFLRLQSECRALSSGDLLLSAGLDCEDETGNHYVILAPALKWPAEGLLLKDWKVFRVLSEQPRGLPFCEYARQNYPFLIAFYRGKGGVPWWDTRCYRQCVPVFTYRGGRKVDELTSEYLQLADAGEWPIPIALDFVDSADRLPDPAGSERAHTVLLADDLEEWRERHQPRPDFRPTAFVTNGPEILHWQWSSDRDYVANGNWFEWSRYRWMIRFKVASPAGLKEIRIMDGPVLFRRFLPRGAKEYERVIHLTHNQQKNLVLIVTDNAGRTAYGGELLDRNHLMELFYCSDRMNTLSYSCLPSDGPFGSTVGTWPLTTMAKGPLTDNLFIELNLDMYRFPGYDGQPGGHLLLSPTVYVHTAQGSEGGRFNRRILRPMASADVALQETTFEHNFAPGVKVWNSWNNLGPLVPAEIVKGRLRYTTFVHPGHLPAPVLVEGELEMLKDGRFSEKRELPIHLAFVGAPYRHAGYGHVTIRHTRGRDVDFDINYDGRPQLTRWSGAFPTGAYAYVYHSIFGPGGLFGLEDGLQFRYVGPPLYRINVGFPVKGKEFHKGDRISFRYLAFTGGYDALPSNLPAERFRDLLGLDGTPGYSVTCEHGEVESSLYVLRVDGGGVGFAGTITVSESLPAILPLVVEGLNDRWTAVHYERRARRYRPIGMHEGRAYSHLNLTGPKPAPVVLFVGHPFTCDRDEMFLTLVQTGKRELLLQVHNPTDRDVSTVIRRSKWFDLADRDEIKVQVPAGDSVTIRPLTR